MKIFASCRQGYIGIVVEGSDGVKLWQNFNDKIPAGTVSPDFAIEAIMNAKPLFYDDGENPSGDNPALRAALAGAIEQALASARREK